METATGGRRAGGAGFTMTYELDRRTVLKGIAAGAITVTYAGPVTAGDGTRYLVLIDSPGVQKRVENAGFSIQHALADGTALLAVGPSSKRSKLEDTNGVIEVAEDFRVELETPEFHESKPSERGKGGSKGGRDEFSGAEESTDEEFFHLQWDKQDLTTDAAIAHERATGAGATVAVIDTGIEFDHPDLAGNVDVDAGRLFRAGEVSSGTGLVELPKDFLDRSAGTETVERHVANDVYGHGTHVAGIAAASNEGSDTGSGVIGTAPDAGVVSLRVFWWTQADDGSAILGATFGDILTAIDHAADIGMDAMNLSIGTPPLPPEVNASGIRGVSERVINNATRRGTVVVVSAGNSSADLQNGTFTWPNSMAGAMSISATGPNDKLVFYSNFGTNEISVGAPGGGFETLEKTLSDDTDWPFPTNLVLNAMDPDTLIGLSLGGVEYAYLAGTSMAAPQVTGTAALVREWAPGSDAEQVEKAIEQGAEHVPGESDDELGAGRLNCDRALDADAIN